MVPPLAVFSSESITSKWKPKFVPQLDVFTSETEVDAHVGSLQKRVETEGDSHEGCLHERIDTKVYVPVSCFYEQHQS